MSEAEQLLTDLLDDQSFNRWIKGKATITIYSQQQSEEVNPEPLYSHVEVGYGEKANLKISDGSRIPKGEAAQDHHVLFPIPQSELDRNEELEQNPGY